MCPCIKYKGCLGGNQVDPLWGFVGAPGGRVIRWGSRTVEETSYRWYQTPPCSPDLRVDIRTRDFHQVRTLGYPTRGYTRISLDRVPMRPSTRVPASGLRLGYGNRGHRTHVPRLFESGSLCVRRTVRVPRLCARGTTSYLLSVVRSSTLSTFVPVRDAGVGTVEMSHLPR